MIWKEQRLTVMEGQGIEMHILHNPPIKIVDTPQGQKANHQYVDWKKDDSLIKSWIRGSLSRNTLSGQSIKHNK